MPGRQGLRADRLALTLAAALCGCVRTSPASLPPAALGSVEDVPVAVVTGESWAFFVLQAPPLGDARLEAAVRDARSKMDNDGLINAAVTRRELCFPACSLPLFSYERTTVTGTLVRYHGVKDAPAPRPDGPPALPVGQAPPVEAQARRLEDLFARGPQAAGELVDSLGAEARGQLRDFILSQDGVASSYSLEFAVSPTLPDGKRRFLDWFVTRYTNYKLVTAAR